MSDLDEFKGAMTAKMEEVCRCVEEFRGDIRSLNTRVTALLVQMVNMKGRVQVLWIAAGSLATVALGLLVKLIVKV